MGNIICKIENVLMWVTKRLVMAIPVVMLIGFVWGNVFESSVLKAGIIPMTILMVYPMMVNLNMQKVLAIGDLRLQIAAQILNFALLPFVALLIGKVFFGAQAYYVLGFLLAGLLPTSGMTISWTGFAKGNVEAAVKMTVIGLTAGSFLTPVYIKWLLGADIAVNVPDIIKQIMLVVFLPMLLGQLTRQYLLRKKGAELFKTRIVPSLSSLSTAGVLGVIFIAIALKARAIWGHPGEIVTILIPVILLYVLNYMISTLLARKYFSRKDAIAFVYGTVMRNLSIALAIAMNSFGAHGTDAALVICFAYIVQVQSAAWYVRLTDRVFGESGVPEVSPARN
jgi:ACR3 family arsenite efflux pump ArsB